MLRILMMLLLAISVAACAKKYRVDQSDVYSGNINLSDGVYLVMPEDGIFEGQTYFGSGRMVQDSIEIEFRKRGVQTRRSSAQEYRDDAFFSAEKYNMGYVLLPKILHWEDRATEWSGRPDRITIGYDLYRVNDQGQVSSMTVSASSPWATWGGDHPQDLVPETIRRFLNSM